MTCNHKVHISHTVGTGPHIAAT